MALERMGSFRDHAFGETDNVRGFDEGTNALAHYLLLDVREGRLNTATEEAFLMG